MMLSLVRAAEPLTCALAAAEALTWVLAAAEALTWVLPAGALAAGFAGEAAELAG